MELFISVMQFVKDYTYLFSLFLGKGGGLPACATGIKPGNLFQQNLNFSLKAEGLFNIRVA